MDPFSLLLPGLVGAAVAAAVLAVTGRLSSWRQMGVALALALGFVAARLLVKQPTSFPPTYGENWLFVLGGFAAISAVVFRGESTSLTLRVVYASLLSFVGVHLLLGELPTLENALLLTAIYGGAGVALSIALERLSRSSPRLMLLGGPAVTCGVATALFALHFSGGVAKTFAAIALVHTAVVAMTWKRDIAATGPSVATLFGPLFALTLVVGTQYGGEVPVGAQACLALAPLAAFLPELTPLRRRRAWVRLVVGAALAIGVASAAFVFLDADPAAENPYGAYR